MTTPEISGYKFETFQEGGEVFARPVNPYPERLYMGYGESSQTWNEMENWCIDHTYPILNLPAGQTVEGSELEVVWQYNDSWGEWKFCENNIPDYYSGMTETRIALRHKSPAQQNDTNVEVVEETPFDIIRNGFKEHCWLIVKYNEKGGEADYQTVAESSEALAKLESQQSQSETIKAVLEYVAKHAGELIYSDSKDELRYGLLYMQSDIEKQLKK